jgi:hypothetical protein
MYKILLRRTSTTEMRSSWTTHYIGTLRDAIRVYKALCRRCVDEGAAHHHYRIHCGDLDLTNLVNIRSLWSKHHEI